MSLTENLVLIFWFSLVFLKCFNCVLNNNVCKSINDYKSLNNNPRCWYNPDVGATPEEIIRRYHYPFEKYEIKTEDGYFVTVFRIPHNGTESSQFRPPILLQHGIAVDSASWLTCGYESPAFILVNSGYDLWIGNARGTRFSSKHKKYSVFDKDYWEFSFHEIGVFELPAVIDFIVEKTNQQVFYIGHSMGTAEGFVYASLKRDHAARNVKKIIALAPIAKMRNLRSPVGTIYPFRQALKRYADSLGLFGIGDNVEHLLDIARRLCLKFPTMALCIQLSALIAGINVDELAVENLPVFFSSYGQGFSLQSLNHFAQIMERNGRFQFYDYGTNKNLLLYGNKNAPDYPVSLIKIPIDLIYGNNDYLSERENVWNLYKQLQTKKSIREFRNYSHLDFLAAKSVRELYKTIVDLLK